MKKIFTHSILIAGCFCFFTSCSKEVKAPAKVAGANAASTTTYNNTQTTNQNQSSHTCGGGNSSSNNNGGGY